MKHIFTSMALLIAKIAVFGVRRTHVRLTKNKCIHNVSLFSADFGQDHTFLRMRLVKQQLLMILDNTVLSAEIG